MDKQQILIVDDEEVNRAILSGVFESEYSIIEAVNGQEATVALENNQNIVLILLDVCFRRIWRARVYAGARFVREDSCYIDYRRKDHGQR